MMAGFERFPLTRCTVSAYAAFERQKLINIFTFLLKTRNSGSGIHL
jgi:hypothetical protein